MLHKYGFSLIELLVVLVIIGILAVIAYPNYSAHLIKTRRAHAAIALMDLAGKLEQYYLLNNTYQNANLTDLNSPEEIVQGFYRLVITQANANSYSVVAIPQSAQVKDTQCENLVLNQLGEKNISGSGDATECW